MTWLLASILPPLLWGMVNHIDKYLLSKAHHKSSVEVLMVYSTGFSVVLLPILFWFAKHELVLRLDYIFIQILGGVLLATSIYFYLKALYKDEASVVVPLFLLVPVFGYVLSYFFLGERLSMYQIVACFLILIGSLILSLEIKEELRFRLNHGVLFLMILSTLAQALQEILFKRETIENSFITSFFWLHIGILLFGSMMVLLKKGLLFEFIDSVKKDGKIIVGVNIVSELVSSAAYMIRNFALLLVPVVIVMTLNGFQPAFVFVIGTVLTILTPRFVQEKIKLVHLMHKSFAIILMVIGAVLVAQTL